ncbi:hypothetical protein M885DRAFT_460321 [Pelagophyceae sp. CCMP2097]|nr:hypothetical protein M885DRAFT_460321 [Pelagophyceae sp. CCMP2097]
MASAEPYLTRRAAPDDGPAVSALVTACGGTPKFRKRFGQFNVAQLLECGYFPIVVHDETGELRLFAVFSDAPKTPAAGAQSWLSTFNALYVPGEQLSLGNTVFLEFCVTDAVRGRDALEEGTQFAMVHLDHVDHVILVLSANEAVPAELADLFLPLQGESGAPLVAVDDAVSASLDGETKELLAQSSLSKLARSRLVPTLAVRRAAVEDSDDLLPIFEAQSEIVTANFGDFFLAELIEAQDPFNKAVVAEVQGRAVGLLAVSTDIDVGMLQACFQLEAYGGLIKRPPQEPVEADAADSDEVVSNVFAITLFCLDEAHEARARDFYGAMFSLFPDREYCVVTAPPPTTKNQKPPAFLKCFTAVPSSLTSTFSHSLMLLHRDALLAPLLLQVQRYSAEFEAGARALLDSENRSPQQMDTLLQQCLLETDLSLEENPGSCAFVGTLDGAVVSLGLVSGKEAATQYLNWLKANYDIESFLPFERHRARAQGVLKCCVVNPIYAPSARFILKEMMRLYEKTVLYHLADAYAPAPSTVVREMVAVRPRWRPTPAPHEKMLLRLKPASPEDEADAVPDVPPAADAPAPAPEEALPAADVRRGEPLRYIARHRLATPKACVRARVVVVGLSTCAIALLEALIFDPDYDLTSITVVSPGGLRPHPRTFADKVTGSAFGAVDEDFSDAFELEALGLAQRCRVIDARVVDLDREGKAVVLPDGALVLYDILVLATGLQEASHRGLERDSGDALVPLLGGAPMLRATSSTYEDSFDIETDAPAAPSRAGFVSLADYDAADRIRAALAFATDVLVYGGTLDALAAVRAILDFGVDPSNVSLVLPTSQPDSLGDMVVDRVALAALRATGVTVLPLRELVSLSHDEETGELVGASFWRKSHDAESMPAGAAFEEVYCTLIIGAAAPDVAPDVFAAVNEAGLVYDGRLVVDAKCRTADASIYAVGRHTKFSEVHRRAAQAAGGKFDALYHHKCNSNELGGYCARCILEDAVFRDGGDIVVMPEPLPVFSKPRTVSAALPGGLCYARCALPVLHDDCKALPTGMLGAAEDDEAPEDGGGASLKSLRDLAAQRSKYSVAKIDSHGILAEVVYLGKEAVEPRNLSRLVGSHEAYLNSAWQSYQRGVVDDWIAFFRGDWCSALTLDRGAQLQETLLALLQGNDGARAIVEQLLADATTKDDSTLRDVRAHALGVGGESLPQETKDLLLNAVVGYLRKNRGLLPRYHLPDAKKDAAAKKQAA